MPPGGPGRPRPGGGGSPPPPAPPPQPPPAPPPAPAVITALQTAVAALEASQCETCIPTPIPIGNNVLGTAEGTLTWIATEECP